VTRSITTIMDRSARMGEKTIKKVLMNSGLTEKEAEVYIFLAQHDVRKGADIARLLRKDRAQVFRILRRLQTKGFVEATLEFPKRFTVVPFENIIDSIVNAKQKEVDYIKEAKEDLLDFMSKKRKAEVLEKFLVVKGNRRIYQKISQIIKDTKQQLSVVATFKDLMRSYRFGIFDNALDHPLRSHVQFRFLTEFSKRNSRALKAVTAKIPKTDFNFKVKNPDLGFSVFPRMITRDNEELLFFTSRTDKDEKADICLWTNCKSIVQTFTAVFDDLWRNSTELQEKIAERETGKSISIQDPENSEKKYWKTLREAKNEIVVMTSAKNLINFWEWKPPLEKWKKKAVSIKIMAPITKENFEIAEQLSNSSEVRHIAESRIGTTVVDGKHVFQFKTPLTFQEAPDFDMAFKPEFYSNNLEYVSRVKCVLNSLWRKARAPSPIMLKSIVQPPPEGIGIDESYISGSERPNNPYTKIAFPIERKPGTITERQVLDKMLNAKKNAAKNCLKDEVVFYGKFAEAVIHPPEQPNLPEMIIQVCFLNEKSYFGEEKWLSVLLQLDTPKGKAFVPVASVQDRAVDLDYRERLVSKSPAIRKIQILDKGQFQVQTNGNILFAGWTKPIPLLGKYTLPPSCLLFEGYGKTKSGVIKIFTGTSFEQTWEYNGLEAFVTFFHPSSKYSGPGTDGRLGREIIITQSHSLPSPHKWI
jgi:sugar-specific transcriptional regulator TrmB